MLQNLSPRLLALVLATPLAAQAGSLDPMFGVGGVAITAVNGSAVAVAVQPDGKILAIGSDDVAGLRQWAVLRYATTGLLDASFGSGGRVALFIGDAIATAKDVAIDTTGRIVVTGWADGGFTTVRLLGDGTLDSSFGQGGVAQTAIANLALSVAVAIAPDGKIVVGGASHGNGRRSSDAITIVRYDTNGQLDTDPVDGFGPLKTSRGRNGTSSRPGIVTDDIDRNLADGVREGALLVLADGRILVGGFSGSSVDDAWLLARYTVTGELDSSFGQGGRTDGDLGLDSEQVRGLAVLADGRIIAAGRVRDLGLGTDAFDAAVVRYSADGQVDATFGVGGIARTILPGDDQGTGPQIDAQGRIAIGLRTVAGMASFRFLGNGTADLAHGVNGLGAIAGGFGVKDAAHDPSGRLIVVGYGGFVIARYLQ